MLTTILRQEAIRTLGQVGLMVLVVAPLMAGPVVAGECTDTPWRNEDDGAVKVTIQVRNKSSDHYWFTDSVDGQEKQIDEQYMTVFRESYLPTSSSWESRQGRFEVNNVDTDKSATCTLYFTMKKVNRENALGGASTWRRIRIDSSSCRIDDGAEIKIACEHEWIDDRSVFKVSYTINDG
jgi:hypothetical protein